MMDVIVTTRSNPLWLARCLASLRHCLPHECGLHVESESKELSWRDNLLNGIDRCSGELVFVIQDDAQLMYLRPSWMDELRRPFEVDPFVAVSCMTATSCGYPHQSVRLALPPGPYYTTQFIPIAFMARREALREAVTEMEDDTTGDHEPSLVLMMKGYKIVMNTHLPVYHEGMQTNLRVYGGDDVKGYVDRVRSECTKRIRAKYPPIWIQRLEATEMVPMQNYLAKTANGMEVRI